MNPLPRRAQAPRPRRALFLDIDGVLNFNLYDLNAPKDPRILDRACVARVRAIVESSGCEVVLSSSWPEDVAREILSSYGIDIDDALNEDRKTYAGRPVAIKDWIGANPDVVSWAILDDDKMTGWVAARLVRTDSDVGITDADVERVIVLLAFERRVAP